MEGIKDRVQKIAHEQLLEKDCSADMEHLQVEFGKERVREEIEQSGFYVILKKYL